MPTEFGCRPNWIDGPPNIAVPIQTVVVAAFLSQARCNGNVIEAGRFDRLDDLFDIGCLAFGPMRK